MHIFNFKSHNTESKLGGGKGEVTSTPENPKKKPKGHTHDKSAGC